MFRLDRDGRLWIIYLRLTDDQYLELFSDAIADRAAATENIGLNHLCLTVDDLDAVIEQLSANGVPLTRPNKMAIDRNHQAAHPGLRVRIEPTVPDGLPTRLQTALRAGSPPDVIDAQHRWVVPYAQAGLLQPLDDALDSRRLLARISTTTRGTGSCGGCRTASKRTRSSTTRTCSVRPASIATVRRRPGRSSSPPHAR
jgi:hypothetical protein